jgi:DnaK suppressor protein
MPVERVHRGDNRASQVNGVAGNMLEQEQFKNRLLELKQEVSDRINAIDRDIRHEGISADWAEQVTERENDEVLSSLGHTANQDLVLINAALKRIAADEYFLCSACGEDIPPARLDLLPFSSLCVNCANKLEKQ